jgi:hypothetical protein
MLPVPTRLGLNKNQPALSKKAYSFFQIIVGIKNKNCIFAFGQIYTEKHTLCQKLLL